MHVVPKWDRQAVPFLGPCLGSFFKVFCIRVAEAQCFGFNETLRLMATGQATVGFGRPTSISCERVAFRGAPAAPPE